MLIKKSRYVNIKRLFFQNTKLKLEGKVEILFTVPEEASDGSKLVKTPIKVVFSTKDEVIDELEVNQTGIIYLKVKPGKMNCKIYKDDKSVEDRDFKVPKTSDDGHGIMSGAPIETPDGPRMIEDILAGDIIYDEDLEPVMVTGSFCWTVSKDTDNYPILIPENSCGIKLPYCDIRFAWTHSVTVKRVCLTGKNLLLQGKAKKLETEEVFNYYNLQTKGFKNFLVAGFLSKPTNKRI